MSLFLTSALLPGWLGARVLPQHPVVHHRSLARTEAGVMLIEATQSCAEEQRAAYFELMPSRELPIVSFDTRLLKSKEKDAFEAQILARQEGTVGQWKNIGAVACESEAQVDAAVQKQFELITEWAVQVCNDFETNSLLMSREEGAAPIQIGWVVRPPPLSLFKKLSGKTEEKPTLTEVTPPSGSVEDLRCGFLGVLSREYRGGGVSARYERIVLGKAPEVPYRDPSQAKYLKGPYVGKGRVIP